MDRRAQQLEHAMTILILGIVALGLIVSMSLLVHAGIAGGHTLPSLNGVPNVGTDRAMHEISQFRYDLLARHETVTAWLCPATGACGVVGIILIGALRVRNLNAKSRIWNWRVPTLRRDRIQTIRDHALGAVVFTLLACFGCMVLMSGYLSGCAAEGKVENGRFFVASHSRYSEVTRTQYDLATLLEWVGFGSLIALLCLLAVAIVQSIRRDGLGGLRR